MYREWIENGLRKEGKTAAGLADVLRVHPSQITRMLKEGGRRIKADELAKIAEYLGDQPPAQGRLPATATIEPPKLTGAYKPPPEFFGARDLPVFSAVEGGPGEIVVSTDPIDYVPRPWFLQHVKEGYAVIVTGESMVPVYEPGDMVLVNPKLPAVRGKNAIFASSEHDSEFKATVKRLERSTPRDWLVKQWNPPEGAPHEFALSKAQWPRALRIVGKYEGT